MFKRNKISQFIFSTIVILSVGVSTTGPQTVLAQSENGIKRQLNAENGKVSFIGPENGRVVSAAKALGTFIRPQDPAMALAKRFGPEFGLGNSEHELSVKESDQNENGRLTVRYQQKHQDIPVIGGELIVNTNTSGDLYSMNGEVSPDLTLSIEPTINSEEAKQTALQAVEKWYQGISTDFIATEPELWIYDESLLRPSNRPVELVWRMEVTAAGNGLPVRELVLVNAQRGNITLHFNQIDTAWHTTNSEALQQSQDSISMETPKLIETPDVDVMETHITTKIPILSEEVLPLLEIPLGNSAADEFTALTGATWYVATTGNDSNSCSMTNAPCRTIQVAVNKAAAGDTVKVAIGTYTEIANWILVINKNVVVSGGWNSDFLTRTGMSILDAQNARNAVGTGNNITSTLDHVMIINSLYNGISIGGGSTMTVNNSVISQSAEGGIIVSGILHLNNSTVSRNQGPNGAGIRVNHTASAYINNSTIARNSSTDSGGGIQVGYGNVYIKNSIIAQNNAVNQGQDCSSLNTDNFYLISQGHNIIGDVANCHISLTTGDQTNVDPLLTDWLAVGYFALLPGSPAINSGDSTSCLATDQRSVTRDSSCDIGSFEYFLPGPASRLIIQAGNNQRILINSEMDSPVEALVLDNLGNPISGVNVTFTAPSTGASGIFITSNTTSTSVPTNLSGIASASQFRANSITGAYTISAQATNIVQTVFFSMTNTGWFVSPTGSDLNSCSSPSSPCLTIAGAINKAQPGDTLFVAQGTYFGTGDQVVHLTNGKSLNFSGGWNPSFTSRTGRSTIDGENARKGIVDASNGNTTFEHFVIQNALGGGIRTSANSFTLIDSIIQNNVVESYGGAGIFVSTGNVTIVDSLIKNNLNNSNFSYPGGGIFHRGGTLTLNRTTISNNKSTYASGGGVSIDFGASLIIENSTISGNMANGNGGGLLADYNVNFEIYNSTITNNMAQNGGGLFIDSTVDLGTYKVQNSIIANNTANTSGPDCFNTGNSFDILSYSLLGNSSNCNSISGTGNKRNISAGLSPMLLGWPGFYPLASNSPAINAGTPGASSTCLSTDQRGINRSSPCDMGAFEYVSPSSAALITIVSGSPQSTPPSATFPNPFKVVVTDSNINLISGVTVTFAAPGTGSSGKFSTTNTTSVSVVTQSDGTATSPSFVANNIAGAYQLSASVSGVSVPSIFQLTNFDAWYVTPTGNNSNNCMVPSTPCATISGVFAKTLFNTGNLIKLAGGVYQAGSNASEVIVINRSAIISGGWNSTFTLQNQTTIIDGQGVRRGLRILGGTTVSFDRIVVKNGQASDMGGGILNDGSLTLSNCLIENNRVGTMGFVDYWTTINGGGIYNTGSLTIANCSIQKNYANSRGGGIFSDGSAPLSIDRTKIIGNDALHEGGGIYYDTTLNLYDDTTSIAESAISGNTAGDGGGIYLRWGTLNINNSTVSYNAATSAPGVPTSTGGGINLSSGRINLNNSTISSNFSNGDGGGINNDSGELYLNNVTVSHNITPLNRYGSGVYNRSDYAYYKTISQNSLIALNSGGHDCFGNVISNGYNLIGSVDNCNYASSTGDLLGTAASPIYPLLSTPRDNGGNTSTVAPFTGNPAINAGNPNVPGSGQYACLATDQRGVSRSATRCDIGAFEGSIAPIMEPNVAVFTNGNESTSEMLGSFLCGPTQVPCTNNADIEADQAQAFAVGIQNLYFTNYGRNGVNNLGLPILITVHYAARFDCPNAAWDGAQMFYCSGTVADDIVAHEFTHAVTQYESNLFSYFQSGAINESFSDIWGEYYDQTNGQGNDLAGMKWLLGEDATSLGIVRNMSNPPAFSDPDKMSSSYYYEGEGDSGGVHTNSGVNNKAAYLMVDGGTFNTKTVTPLGWAKTVSIYYRAQTNLLTSGADYSDLYYALQQACSDLIGQNGITSGDCLEVKDALDAVEMNSQPAPNFNTDAPLCDTGLSPTYTFTDDLEAGTSNWTLNNGSYTRWQIDSPEFGPFAQSGDHSLYADDFPDVVTNAGARLSSFTVPPNGYLHFAHAYDFESYQSNFYDGGVLEYSINGGSRWSDTSSLIDYNGYKGVITNGFQNPISGRWAFVGTSHGYTSTRLNLASLVGKTVIFRWRMGLDNSGFAWGWWVDNVKVYSCLHPNHNVDVKIGNTLMGIYYVPGGSSVRQSFSGVDNGPAKIVSTNSADILAALRIIWKEPGFRASYSEMMGLPLEQLSTEYWFPWYNNAVPASMDQGFRIGNVNATSTAIQVWVGTTLLDSFNLSPGVGVRVSYPVDNGPIRIVCTDCSGNEKIIAALRVIWKEPGMRFSYSEMMGLPKEQLSSEYWFPWYNNAVPASMDQGFRIANVSSTENNTVEVWVGTTKLDTFSLNPGASTRVSYNVDNGPIKILCTTCTNTGDDKIIAALRVIWKEPGFRASYSEMMGLPKEQLSDEYWFPWYNNAVPASMDQGFRIANVSPNESNTVEVWVGTTKLATISLAAGASTRVGYTVDNGPIRIVCTTCTNSNYDQILAALRVIWKEPGYRASYSEMMGLPVEALSTEYWFPWYNFAAPNSMDQGFRIAVP